jgi:SWI/SNF-related matrix-associated actin-dependent regulator 1 of chromatin subfamily A
MIKIENIKAFTALNKLREYNGKNPYLKKLKSELTNKGKLSLTSTQEEYIISNFDFEPYKVDRVIGISEYLGEEFKKKYDLPFVPNKMYIGFILGENEKSFHVFGKLKKNQKQNEIYWVPKTQIMEDPYYTPVDIDIDFEKYEEKDKLGRKLYEHQKDGIEFLVSRKKCILADDMGLGKTLQSVMGTLAAESKKVLIICPSSTKINWEREINMFGEYDTSIISGRKWKPAKYTIINYDILKNFHTVKKRGEKPIEELTHILDEKFDTLIVDEAHYLKNHKSIRGSIVTDLVKKNAFENVWLLTGTPVANRPKDLYNLLKIIGHPLSDNWQFYVKRYCDAKNFKKKMKNGKIKNIWVIDGNSNLNELSIRIKNKVLRRMKEDVLDMPEKTIIPVFNELTSKEWVEYDNLWEEYLIKRKEQKKRGKPQRDLVELILLRQFIALKSIPNTIELAENALEEGKKIIIFTTFTDELLELQEHFGNQCVVHNGSMSDKDKQFSVDEFQNNPKKKVFIGNIMSAGVGITLTAADTVIFNSFDWVPGNNEQAEDRSYRIGQKNNVSVYYQLFEDTISTRMWYTLKHKKNVIDQIIGNNDDDDMDDIVKDIIE